MFCPKCGNRFNDDERFCGKCGEPIEKANSSDNHPFSKNNRSSNKLPLSITMISLYIISVILFVLEAMLWMVSDIITVSGMLNFDLINESFSLSSAFSDELSVLSVVSLLASAVLCLWAILSGASKHRLLVFQKTSIIWCFWWYFIELLNVFDAYSFSQADEFANIVKIRLTGAGWLMLFVSVGLCALLFVISAKSKKLNENN